MDLRRHEESKRLLKIHWIYPALLEIEEQTGPTRSEKRMVALSREEAIAKLIGEDDRPLLILRECDRCKGTNHAVLSRRLNNERTQLLMRFFRCVKFKTNVLEENHTYRKLFAEDHPPHLMLVAADGESSYEFTGNQEQRHLHKAMEKMLRREHSKSADRAVKHLLGLMSKYDVMDLDRKALEEEYETEVEKDGPRSSRARSLKRKLDKVETDIGKLRTQEDKILDLGPKPKQKQQKS